MHLHCRLDCRKFWWCDTSRMDQAHSNHNANTRNHCLEFLTQLADRSSINPSMNQSKHILQCHMLSADQRNKDYWLTDFQKISQSHYPILSTSMSHLHSPWIAKNTLSAKFAMIKALNLLEPSLLHHVPRVWDSALNSVKFGKRPDWLRGLW